MKIKSYSILIIMLLAKTSFAQQTKLIVRNTPDEHLVIELKWYSQQLIYKKGVDVFRKETGQNDWIKINTNPIIGFQTASTEIILQDSTFNTFAEMAKQLKTPDPNGLLLLNVILKSFISIDFSNYLGIYYKDTSVEKDKRYRYKVINLNNDKILAASDEIVAGTYKKGKRIDSLKIEAGEKLAKLKWQLEEERFYATNIYRNKVGEKDWLKLNNKPVLITEAPNAEGKQAAPKYLFIDDSLQEGLTYNYKVAGIDFFGSETEMSEIVSVIIEDVTPPYPPEALKKDSVRKLNVYLSWKVAKEEVGKEYIGYKVYRSNKSEGLYELVSNTILGKADTTYTDTVKQPNPYYYYVTAVDEAGNETKSNLIFAEVADVFPPNPPQNLIATADTGKIKLTWDANVEPDIKGYHIYRTAMKDDARNFVLLNAYPHLDTFFIDLLPKRARSKFIYKILAIDSSYNKSDFSDIVSIRMPDVIAPEQAIIKSIKVDTNGLLVSWIANVELDLMHYELYRKEKGDSLLKQIGIINKSKKVYFDKELKNNTTYQYALVATDSANNKSEFSPLFSVSFVKNMQEKSEISKLKVKYSKGNKQVKLKWEIENKPDYLGTVIFKKDTADVLKPLTGMLKSAVDFVDKAIVDKQIYWYEQRAYFKNGQIIRSEQMKVEVK